MTEMYEEARIERARARVFFNSTRVKKTRLFPKRYYGNGVHWLWADDTFLFFSSVFGLFFLS